MVWRPSMATSWELNIPVVSIHADSTLLGLQNVECSDKIPEVEISSRNRPLLNMVYLPKFEIDDERRPRSVEPSGCCSSVHSRKVFLLLKSFLEAFSFFAFIFFYPYRNDFIFFALILFYPYRHRDIYV